MSDLPRGPVRVLMVAIGGYGYYYLRTLLDEVSPERAVLAGVVDPEAGHSRAWPEVAALGVPVSATVEDFYGAGHGADLAVVVSPIHLHVPQAVAALAHGSNVLCDKPLGATIQEAGELMSARSGGRWVMIGYQWSYSAAIQALKADILAGLFGRPTRFSALCCWPRDRAYYDRNDWAGRLRDPRSGRWVLDSPANNAMAHSLHNLLYLAGAATDRSAVPASVQAELYRAHDIDSCDTAAVRVRTGDGPEVLFYASHATEGAVEPRFRLELEDAVVVFGDSPRSIVATGRRGTRKEYGAPDDTPQFKKLTDAIAAVTGPAHVVCGPEAAAAQTLSVNGMHESVPEAACFPPALVEDVPSTGRRLVRGLGGVLAACYERGQLPHETGVDWASPGAVVDLAGYRWFPRTAPSSPVTDP